MLRLSPSLFFSPISGPKYPFFLLKLSPCLFLWSEKSFFFFKIGKFLDLILKCFRNFWSKKFFFYAEAQPKIVFWARKVLSFFFFKFFNFRPLYSIFPPTFCPTLFFLAGKVPFFLFYLKIGQFLAFLLNFFPSGKVVSWKFFFYFSIIEDI